MTVALSIDGAIELSGMCSVEDADVLLQHLLADPQASVDWSMCQAAHSAVIQVLLAARVNPVGQPLSGFLKDRIEPLLRECSDPNKNSDD